MTVEQIVAINEASAASNALRKRQDEERKQWEEVNLYPLLRECDHTYPWGASAITRDYSASHSRCSLCGRCPDPMGI